MSETFVPRISLAAANAPQRLDDAASAVGFFQICDHGIPDSVIQAMKRESADFFALPFELKKQCSSPSPEVNRGYAAKGTEGLSYSIGHESPPDLFEAFNLGPDDVSLDAPWHDSLFFAENIWPHGRPEFKSALLDYFAEVQMLAHRMTNLFAKSLNLPHDFFDTYTDHSTDTLRVNHYQRRSGEPDPVELQFGMGAHTDYGIVTILYADQVPGLQILGPTGDWVSVEPEDGCFLVNLGDLTAQWTNDRWRSTLHRVLPPQSGVVRRSVAFFHDGNYDARISCLPTCTSPDNPPKYLPVTAGEHLMAKLVGPRTFTQSQTTNDTTGGRTTSV
jgi:isopenicillin N synthase-like dioxygenase